LLNGIELNTEVPTITIFNKNIFSVLEDNYYNRDDRSNDTFVNNFFSSSFSLELADKISITSYEVYKSPLFKFYEMFCFTKT